MIDTFLDHHMKITKNFNKFLSLDETSNIETPVIKI